MSIHEVMRVKCSCDRWHMVSSTSVSLGWAQKNGGLCRKTSTYWSWRFNVSNCHHLCSEHDVLIENGPKYTQGYVYYWTDLKSYLYISFMLLKNKPSSSRSLFIWICLWISIPRVTNSSKPLIKFPVVKQSQRKFWLCVTWIATFVTDRAGMPYFHFVLFCLGVE